MNWWTKAWTCDRCGAFPARSGGYLGIRLCDDCIWAVLAEVKLEDIGNRKNRNNQKENQHQKR